MKRLASVSLVIPLTVCLAIPALAGAAKGHSAKKTWTRIPKERTYYGDISDSMCGAHHKMAGNPQECTRACIKAGAKYVFVTRGKVLEISNQGFPELEKFAGEHVRLRGTRSADGKSIAVAKLVKVVRRTRKKKAKTS